jgi:tRNA 2-thiouridine synthesizing protein E
MPTIEYNDITINVDDEGYLLNAEEWDEKVACGLTQTVEDVDECDLTDDRLEILRFMRDYYMRFESFPRIMNVCTSSSLIRSRRGKSLDFPNRLQTLLPGSCMSWTERTSVINSLIIFSLRNESQILTSHPHPTLSEAIMEATEVAAGSPVHIPPAEKK